MKQKKRKYYCRYCSTAWDEYYLAELCFKVDMENLQREKENKPKIKMK
jgi:hypothetical protein